MPRPRTARKHNRITRLFVFALPTVLGWFMIVVLADLAVGLVLGRGDPPPRPPDLLLDGPTTAIAPDHEIDPRVNSPAMGGVSWSEDYWAQFRSLEYDYVPFLYTWHGDVDLPYFHSRNGIRRSYEPAGLPADAINKQGSTR